MQAGADGLELDVHLSSDGIAVVHHDDLLDRTTDATGALAARTAAARAALPEMAASACHSEAQLAVYRSLARWPVSRVKYDVYQVPEMAGWVRVVSPRFVRDAHTAGLKVQVWTVDDEADMRRLL